MNDKQYQTQSKVLPTRKTAVGMLCKKSENIGIENPVIAMLRQKSDKKSAFPQFFMKTTKDI